MDNKFLKEVLKSNYLSFNPNSVEDIARKINDFIQKKPRVKPKKIILDYSFKKMTQETVDLYNKII